jgi:hypothetical protein
MKQGEFAVLCVILLAIWASDAKAQNQDPRIKQLEDRIEKLEGDLTRIREEYDKQLADNLTLIRGEYDKKLSDKLNALEGVYSLSKVPVGTILPFYGDPSKLPDNWKLCDGQDITDIESPFYSRGVYRPKWAQVPDLRQRLLRGAIDRAELGNEGEVVFVPNHLHTEGNNVHLTFNSYTSPAGSHGHIGGGDISGGADINGGQPKRSVYLTVLFIMRIK